jgi:hypothetical protein
MQDNNGSRFRVQGSRFKVRGSEKAVCLIPCTFYHTGNKLFAMLLALKSAIRNPKSEIESPAGLLSERLQRQHQAGLQGIVDTLS